jgi:hypothetical protein
MTSILPFAIVAMLGVQQAQQPAPLPQPQQPASVTLTGCVVSAEAEDTFKLVPAEPDPSRPVGTSGTTPAWAVPGYLLTGGTVSFAEHANKTVEVTGTIDPTLAPAAPPVGDTTQRTAPQPLALARLSVQTAKVIADTCTPRIVK